MSVELAFHLTVESDWHINAGYGLGSQIDAILERDSKGNPVVSGSTLKGLFRDALHDLYEIVSTSSAYSVPQLGDTPKEAHIAGRILGYAGVESHWTFSAATPQLNTGGGQAGIDGAMVATGVRVNPALRRAEDNKFFTREMGKAQKFTFTIRSNEDADALVDDAMWLVAAASYIRRLGGRRRRGAGRCSIQLADAKKHEILLNNFGATYCYVGQREAVQLAQNSSVNATPEKTTAKRFRVWIHSQRPIVISNHHEAGNTYQGRMDIPGKTLRGALAYTIPSSKRDSAEFRQLFVLGGIHFTDLHPLVHNKDLTALNIESPLGLQQQDNNTAEYHSVMVNEQLKTKGYKGRHLLIDTYPSAKNVENAELQSETHMHVQIDPKTKRALEGNLYAYETPPAGLFYVGEFTLEGDTTWQQASTLMGVRLNQPFDVSIGKGRRRSYGTSTAYIEELQANDPPTWMPLPLEKRLKAEHTQQENKITLTLASDTIYMDTWGRYLQSFETGEWLAKLIDIQDYTISNEFVRTKVIKGFDMRAGLPQWQDIALGAGSSVTIQLKSGSWDINKLRQLEKDGIGLRRSEGYGRVIFNHPAHSGVVEGFTGLKIPGALQIAEHRAAQTLSRSNFNAIWRKELQSKLDSSYAGSEKVASTMRSLSRLLVQAADDPNLKKTIDKFGASTMAKDKDARLSEEDKQLFNRLIDELETNYKAHRRVGIILLAEALAQRSK